MGKRLKQPETGNGSQPVTYDQQTLSQNVDAVRTMLAEIEGITARMTEKGIGSLTLEPGEGAAGYERAKKAIRAWATGLGNALVAGIEKGGGKR